jgi:predicted alpha-1,2-mannosidase
MRQTGAQELEGWVNVCTYDRCNVVRKYRVYFVAQLDRPIESLRFFRQGDDSLREARQAEDPENLGAVVGLTLTPGAAVQMKVGLSYCSVANARLNLKTELDHWDFDRVVEESRAEWNRLLGRVEVRGGTRRQRIKFYTDLWHTLLGRRTLSDVNGQYPNGMHGEIRVARVPLEHGRPRHRMFNSDAFWWTMWNLNQVWAIAYPDVLSEFCQAWLRYHDDDPMHRLPRGIVAGGHSWIMPGPQATPRFALAILIGIDTFDHAKAYDAMKRMHTLGGVEQGGNMDGLSEYLELGYVPYDPENPGYLRTYLQGASLTCDYSYCDWVLAQVARQLGHADDCRQFTERSHHWQNLWSAEDRLIRPRRRDGSWMEPFDPLFGRYVGFTRPTPSSARSSRSTTWRKSPKGWAASTPIASACTGTLSSPGPTASRWVRAAAETTAATPTSSWATSTMRISPIARPPTCSTARASPGDPNTGPAACAS